MKIVGGMKVVASRLARGMVSSANPGIYSKTYPEGSDPFDLGNCRGDECEASIYSKAYTEGSDPLGPSG